YQLPRMQSLDAFQFVLERPALIFLTQTWVGLFGKLRELGVLQDPLALTIFKGITWVAVVALAVWAARARDRGPMFQVQVWLVTLNVAMRASPAGPTSYFEVGTLLLLILLFSEQSSRSHAWLL